jgi:hypothetical protein
VNLVRTHSSAGQFFIVGAHSSGGSISSDSDAEMDTAQSRPSTPADTARTILIDSARLASTTEVSRRPTIEQNMAFAALQQPPDNSVVEHESEHK